METKIRRTFSHKYKCNPAKIEVDFLWETKGYRISRQFLISVHSGIISQMLENWAGDINSNTDYNVWLKLEYNHCQEVKLVMLMRTNIDGIYLVGKFILLQVIFQYNKLATFRTNNREDWPWARLNFHFVVI